MEEPGLWELFFATGLPEAYLALRGQREEEIGMTAFHPGQEDRKQI